MRAGMSPVTQKARRETWGVMAGDLEGRGGKDVGRKVGEQHCTKNYVSAASDLIYSASARELWCRDQFLLFLRREVCNYEIWSSRGIEVMRCAVLMVLFDGGLCGQKVLKYFVWGFGAESPSLSSVLHLAQAGRSVRSSGWNGSACLSGTHTKWCDGSFSLCTQGAVTGRVSTDG